MLLVLVLIFFEESELKVIVGDLFFEFIVVLALNIKERLECVDLIMKGVYKLALLGMRLK